VDAITGGLGDVEFIHDPFNRVMRVTYPDVAVAGRKYGDSV
jgi:hypothetical protein